MSSNLKNCLKPFNDVMLSYIRYKRLFLLVVATVMFILHCLMDGIDVLHMMNMLGVMYSVNRCNGLNGNDTVT